MSSLEYLEEERQKIWAKIVQLNEDIKKKSSDYEKEAKQSSKKASEFRNRSEEAKNETLAHLNDVQATNDKAKELLKIIIELREKSQDICKDIEQKQLQVTENHASVHEKIDLLTEKISQLSLLQNELPDEVT